MCTPSMPGADWSTKPVNGTWTPTERDTDAERQAKFQANLAANQKKLAEGGTLLTGSSADKSPFANNPFSVAARTTLRENSFQAMRADADQAKLAAWDRQGAKAAQAPGRRAAAGGAGGGPTTLLTGGTAADALSVKRTRAGMPSLLGA